MKHILSILTSLFIFVSILAQTPEKMSYQAVVRNAEGALVSGNNIGLKISIIKGSANGITAFAETHTPVSNVNGLISVEIGSGNVAEGDFTAINWAEGPYFLKTETDPFGGTDYSITGTTELLSVPFSLHSKHAETVENIVIVGDEAVFDGWDKDASDDFNGSYKSLIDTPIYVSVLMNDAGYITNETEKDTVFAVSLAATITAKDTARWGEGLPIGVKGNIVTFDSANWVAKDLLVVSGNSGNSQAVTNLQPYIALNYCIALQGLYPSRNAEPFLGEIDLFGFNFAPRGYAMCNGQLLPIAQNTALFSLLGTIYGGDGRTTFALPDMRSRVPVHHGQGPGLSNYGLGSKGGTESIILNTLNLPVHNHPIIISYED